MDEKGFTLIEILVAITITGIMIGGVFTFFNLGFSTWERTECSESWQQHWRILHKYLRNDLHNLFYSPLYQGEEFTGNYESLNIIIFQEDGFKEINYQADYQQGELRRRVTPLGEETRGEEQTMEISFLADLELKRIDFAFFNPENSYWENNWSSQEKGYLPSVLRLTITLTDEELLPVIVEIYSGQEY